MEKVKFDKQVALCALEVPPFIGDANLMPNVLSGPFAGSPFLKCLLHTRVKGLTSVQIPQSKAASCLDPSGSGGKMR